MTPKTPKPRAPENVFIIIPESQDILCIAVVSYVRRLAALVLLRLVKPWRLLLKSTTLLITVMLVEQEKLIAQIATIEPFCVQVEF